MKFSLLNITIIIYLEKYLTKMINKILSHICEMNQIPDNIKSYSF